MSEIYAGVDTHTDFHVVALTDHLGQRLEHRSFDNTTEGLTEAVTWLREHHTTLVGIEGTSSYGAGLTHLVQTAGITVREVTGPDLGRRRREGKADHTDAYAAADAARDPHRSAPVKNNHNLAELRAHYVLRESALAARTAVGNQLHALYLHLHPGQKLGRITKTRMRTLSTTDPILAQAAHRWLDLDAEAEHHLHEITRWIKARYQPLLDQPYVGPVTAAALALTAGDNPERMISEQAFAHLTGVAPINLASGKHQRVRLNRGGDRRANNALWRIAFLRYSRDPKTIAYVERHPHKTRLEILRNLKRYISRELFPILKTCTPALDNQ